MFGKPARLAPIPTSSLTLAGAILGAYISRTAKVQAAVTATKNFF